MSGVGSEVYLVLDGSSSSCEGWVRGCGQPACSHEMRSFSLVAITTRVWLVVGCGLGNWDDIKYTNIFDQN